VIPVPQPEPQTSALAVVDVDAEGSTMNQAFICDAVRTPFGRYGGALSSIRTDDLGALPLIALMERNPKVDWGAVADVLYGCANQAGEDNRNVARMAALLAGCRSRCPARPSTASAARAWTRSARRRAPSRRARPS
jgi:hypothetical protein